MTWDDSFLDACEPLLARYRDSNLRRWSQFAAKCVRLAPNLETCEALMRGEKVPMSRLDPEWVRRYGY